MGVFINLPCLSVDDLSIFTDKTKELKSAGVEERVSSLSVLFRDSHYYILK